MSFRQQLIDKQLAKGGLQLYSIPLQDSQEQYIASKNTSHFKKLAFSNNYFTQKSLRIIVQGNWRNLTWLQVNENNLGSLSCKYLSRIQAKNIQVLRLHSSNVTSQGILHISKAKWDKLTMIDLYQNKLTNDCLKNLLKARLKHIQKIGLDNNRIPAYDTIKMVLLETKELKQAYYGRANRELNEVLNKVNKAIDNRFPNIFSL